MMSTFKSVVQTLYQNHGLFPVSTEIACTNCISVFMNDLDILVFQFHTKTSLRKVLHIVRDLPFLSIVVQEGKHRQELRKKTKIRDRKVRRVVMFIRYTSPDLPLEERMRKFIETYL